MDTNKPTAEALESAGKLIAATPNASERERIASLMDRTSAALATKDAEIEALKCYRDGLLSFLAVVARNLKCLPSYADPKPDGGNLHIINALATLRTERDNLKAEVAALKLQLGADARDNLKAQVAALLKEKP